MKRIIFFLLCLTLVINTAAADSNTADSLVDRISQTEKLIAEAKAQVKDGDRTALSSPVPYNVLWIGYTHVTYGDLDFRMKDSDREYLQAVALNFEKYVEKTTNHNLDISVDLRFIDREVSLTKAEGDDWLYLNRDTVSPDITVFSRQNADGYDTVFTTVQTDGDDNYRRNKGKKAYGRNTVMLGIMTHWLGSDMGYSTFDLGQPEKGKYPLKNPEIQCLYATTVAIHEWLHQLEYMGPLLHIDYPDTHAYMGPPEFYGYTKIDGNNHFIEFYNQVLQGKVPYTGKGGVQYQGMYPKMWKLTKRSNLDYGTFYIRNINGKNLAASGNGLKLTKKTYKWTLRYGMDGTVIISSAASPELRLDLSNAKDAEYNPVKLYFDSKVADAQRWILTYNADGSYFIRTVYSSRRLLTLDKDNDGATIQSLGKDGYQRWFITPAD